MGRRSAIKEMFAGNRGTYDHVPLSHDYEESQNAMTAVVDDFLEKLTFEQQEHFNKAYDYISDKSAAYAEDHFVEGFKFGVLIGIEIGESK